MTAQELLFARMRPEEKQKWQELCAGILNKFEILKLPAMALGEAERILTPGTPYTGSKGYVESEGFFYVEEGDRGKCTLIFKTQSREEAEDLLMKKLAHDVSYRCILAEMKQKEQKWKVEWKYNTTYDYRKYWFELALYILKDNVSEKRFCAEISEYEALMNYWFETPFWKYDTEKTEFICI